jgi:hypothetical protein
MAEKIWNLRHGGLDFRRKKSVGVAALNVSDLALRSALERADVMRVLV